MFEPLGIKLHDIYWTVGPYDLVAAFDAPDDEGDLIAWAEGCGPIRRNGVALPARAWPSRLREHDLASLGAQPL